MSTLNLKVIISLIFLSLFCIAGDYSIKMSGIERTFRLKKGPQMDSTAQNENFPRIRTNSLKSDLLRSAIGTTIGGIVGAGVGGVMPILFDSDYRTRSFPDNSFYLSSYVGASFLAALCSATVLHFSKDRDISYWSLASYSLLPPLILVMPLSVHASVQERDELVKATWVATLTSIGISTFWNVFVYRIYPPRKNNNVAIHFAKPYVSSNQNGVHSNLELDFGIRIIEVHF